jgi:hypothetical protein
MVEDNPCEHLEISIVLKIFLLILGLKFMRTQKYLMLAREISKFLS